MFAVRLSGADTCCEQFVAFSPRIFASAVVRVTTQNRPDTEEINTPSIHRTGTSSTQRAKSLEISTTRGSGMDQTGPLVDVSLFLHGESLDPAQVTLMLGTEGSQTRSKGEKWRTSTGHEVTAKTGLWSLSASRESMSVRDQLSWLRQKLSSATCPPS
jgi:hypothetical protein